jgi:homoserine O-acetyltransferase
MKTHKLTPMGRPEDSEYEVKCMSPGVGTLRVFPSIWGRKYCPNDEYFRIPLTQITDWAGGPGDSKDDVEWLDEQLREFFQKNGSTVREKAALPIRSTPSS